MRISLLIAALLVVSQPSISAAGMLVAVHPIRPRTIVTTNDFEIVDGETAGAIDDIGDVLGLETKVALYPGKPIFADQLGPHASIERNELITLSFRRGALFIVTEGRALDRGGAGEIIRVMNISSKTTLSGRILEDGTVEVGQ